MQENTTDSKNVKSDVKFHNFRMRLHSHFIVIIWHIWTLSLVNLNICLCSRCTQEIYIYILLYIICVIYIHSLLVLCNPLVLCKSLLYSTSEGRGK